MENQHVRLEALSLDHAGPLSEWIADEVTWIWWLHEPPTTLNKLKRAINKAISQGDRSERQPFAIYSKELSKYVGETSFWFDGPEDEIEIGATWLCYATRGTGLNEKVKALMLETAFNALGYSKVKLQTDSMNTRSQSAIEKIGGIKQVILPNDKVTWNGRSRDSVIYYIHKTSI